MTEIEQSAIDPSEMVRVLKEALYDSPNLQRQISEFTSTHAGKFEECDSSGIGHPISLLNCYHEFCRNTLENHLESALEDAGISLSEFYAISRRLCIRNPLSEDAAFLHLLRKATSFEVFMELMRTEHKLQKLRCKSLKTLM